MRLHITEAEKKKKKKVENANHQPVRERSSSGPVRFILEIKG